MFTNEELWQSVLAQIQLNISKASFSTWFKNTYIISQRDNKVTVSVPNSFVKEWLEKKYNKEILKILHNLDSEIKDIEFCVGKENLKTINNKKLILDLSEENQLDFQEFKINKETNLNPRYTFESFVVGPFNELPHAAAVAVSNDPGLIYNPLFIYGGVGLGKTHLLQAIGNEVIKNFPDKKIKYISSEKFTSEVVNSIKNHEMNQFKSKYKNIDVLIIDDIQFLSGKEKTQEEFFHIFNVLYENNKQIILSSDRPPKTIQALTERLRSRFEGGMIADISIPDFETRVAILKLKSQLKGVLFSEEIYQYIASIIQKNIRELEGALNRIIMYQKINNQPINLEMVKNILKNITSSPNKIITPKKIIETVADFYDLKEKDILNNSRKKEIVKPRQIAMYLLREDLKSSFPFIGRKFNGKDHTTAIHSYKKISEEIKENKNLEEEINLIREKLLNS
ncbi:MAG TPA: chromosomal replication initiator protein DnaA [Candidatus Pacearchaeota archaeon]|nr:chromosomal replication initiator protein DnaA [Candidatus Pacearchaeota archaeon]HOL90556.1 chromosomal replication initiator protein DnaA [Candidatus Pacearchaeota archaeon]